MFRKKGFTLIELLVVIAIIAMLLSILTPSLGKVKKIARSVICRSNLRQWGTVFGMYTQSNDEKFYKAWTSSSEGHRWIESTEPYYDDPKICFCPEAAKIEPFTDQTWGSRKTAWAIADPDPGGRIGYDGMAGSYGINDWVGNTEHGIRRGDESWYWTTTLAKGSFMAPLFLDSVWLGGFAGETDTPPPQDDAVGSGQGITRHCVNRHDEYINGVFADFSVRKIGLKELWTLKWHKKFNRAGPWTLAGGATRATWEAAAPWMADFKDF